MKPQALRYINKIFNKMDETTVLYSYRNNVSFDTDYCVRNLFTYNK